MYNLINLHINQIMDSINNSHIAEYDWLMQNIQQVLKPNYQRRYKTYWRLNAARLSQNYCNHYFQCLANALVHPPDLRNLCHQLYQVPTHLNGRQTLQFSFCTKLCHMLNPRLPICDGMVRDFYFFSEPDRRRLSIQQRINDFCNFHQFLITEYSRVLHAGLLQRPIHAFKQQLNPQHFTDVKIIDSLIWAFVNLLRNRGVRNGTISYC